ncbi:PfaB family protein [Shewanella sp. 6_MG-2023]|uniref:PfaB family protein n=1 Tax=Shewanella sp. 6_MG-2023 TaxID=3062660 RepID=UPI0026E3F206|nr:PfaB family protein [Shewanella sp. 6_MG-2023]MDO6617686.1 PfaB family protein [Shewanella sp. 6_MG-2023]
MSNQSTSVMSKPEPTKVASVKSMRIALKLIANDAASLAQAANGANGSLHANNNAFAAIKPCSLAETLGATAIPLEIDVSSLDGTSTTATNLNMSFRDYLAQAIERIEQQQTVLLSHPALPYRLLMMPAIVAAKHRCHPHAYLTGMGEGHELSDAVQQALTQAKRAHVSPTQIDATHCTSYKDKFFELIQLIGHLATRSLPTTNDSENNSTNKQYWFSEMHQSRVASFNFIEAEMQHAVVLVQGTELGEASSLLDNTRLFFPVSANTVSGIQQQLTQLQSQLQSQLNAISSSSASAAINVNHSTLLALMLNNLNQFDHQAGKAAVIMANSIETACSEIEAMLAMLSTSDTLASSPSEVEYKTPSGSCLILTANEPLGTNGLCFVYPGVGTVYPQMFSQLPRFFPDLYAQLERDGDVKAMLQADSIYADNAKVTDMSLGELAIAGVGASYILTKVLSEYFNVKPNFAMGYSMGEAAMWASLGIWKQPHSMIEATQTSTIFTTDISGRLDCVRQAWQLNQSDDIVWNSFVVRATPADIEAVLTQYPRCYLAIIQGDTCVLAGCEASCKALLKQIGKRGIAANRVTAMHTAPAMLIHREVAQFYQQALHHNEQLEQTAQIKFISAASSQPINVSSLDIATSIADTFCQPLNFTELVNNARKLGAKLFVEIGADRQTTTLIDKIARTSPTVSEPCQAIAVNAKGGDDQTALLKCIAQLISHKAPVSLTCLTQGLANLLASTLKFEVNNLQADATLAPQLEGEQS